MQSILLCIRAVLNFRKRRSCRYFCCSVQSVGPTFLKIILYFSFQTVQSRICKDNAELIKCGLQLSVTFKLHFDMIHGFCALKMRLYSVNKYSLKFARHEYDTLMNRKTSYEERYLYRIKYFPYCSVQIFVNYRIV